MASCRNTLGARLCQDWPVTRVVRPFRGVSADERRDLRRSQLLEACLEIAGTAGMAAATVEAVSRQAGLSKRYFYESFRARDELFVALARSLLAEITGGVLDSMADSGSELIDRARMGIGRVITVLTDDPRKARVFTELVGSEMLNDTVGGAEHELAELLTALLLTGTQSDERQYHRLRLATLVIVAGTTKAVTSWLDGKLTVSRDDLIDEIAQMSVAAARTVRSDLWASEPPVRIELTTARLQGNSGSSERVRRVPTRCACGASCLRKPSISVHNRTGEISASFLQVVSTSCHCHPVPTT